MTHDQSSPDTVIAQIVRLLRTANVTINDQWEGSTGYISEAEAKRLASVIVALRASQPATPAGGEAIGERGTRANQAPDVDPNLFARSSAGTSTSPPSAHGKKSSETANGKSREQMLKLFKAAASAVSNGSGGDIRRFYECASDDDLRAALAAFRAPHIVEGNTSRARNAAILECAEVAKNFRHQVLPGDRTICRKIEDAIRALVTPTGGERLSAGSEHAWCQPMDCGEHTPRKFLLYFEDADRGIAVFDNETEAREAFAKANPAWNCYLFGALPLSPDAAQSASEYILPCDVHLDPATTIHAGCKLSTLISAIKLREGEDWKKFASMALPSAERASSVMGAAEKAAEVVEGWSDAKKDYAARTISSPHANKETK